MSQYLSECVDKYLKHDISYRFNEGSVYVNLFVTFVLKLGQFIIGHVHVDCYLESYLHSIASPLFLCRRH